MFLFCLGRGTCFTVNTIRIKRKCDQLQFAKSDDTLGSDQGVMMITGDIGYSNPLIIEARFISQAKDEILADIENSFGLG